MEHYWLSNYAHLTEKPVENAQEMIEALSPLSEFRGYNEIVSCLEKGTEIPRASLRSVGFHALGELEFIELGKNDQESKKQADRLFTAYMVVFRFDILMSALEELRNESSQE